MSEIANIMIVEDHAIVSSGIRLIIEQQSDMNVVCEAVCGEDALELAVLFKPNIILMDISLPDMNGVEATAKILELVPDSKIIALTMHAPNIHLASFIKAGGVGYVSKSDANTALISTIRAALEGYFALNPESAPLLAKALQSDNNDGHLVDNLSKREMEVLIFTVKGFTSSEIGKQLYLSPRTVETHRRHIMDKLGLAHRSELFDFAINNGVI